MATFNKLKISYFLIILLFSIKIGDAAMYISNTVSRSSREPKFKIEFHLENSPFHPNNGQESMVMTNKGGRKYTCFLPTIEGAKTITSVSQHNSNSIILETEHRVKSKTPDELLDILKDNGCLYRHEGWWSYELCHMKHMRQFHAENNKTVEEYFLGVFDAEATARLRQDHSGSTLVKDPRSKDASQRYHAHIYTNGTVCDLTGKPRETEVRFVCSDLVVIISSFKEISTCKYVITVQCPLLCKHPIFQEERPKWQTIHCNEMPIEAKDSMAVEVDKTKSYIITDDSNLRKA